MVKKNASLAGKGVEILYGAKPEAAGVTAENSTEVLMTAEGELSAEELGQEAGNGQALVESSESLAPEWAASLAAEASASDVAPAAEEQAGLTADQGRPDWPVPQIPDEDRPAAPEPEEEMAQLASTPIEGVVEQPAGELPTLATTPASETPAPAVVTQPAEALPALATTPAAEVPAPAVVVPSVVTQPQVEPTAAPKGELGPEPYMPEPSDYVPPVVETAPSVPQPRDKTEGWVSAPGIQLGQTLFATAPRTTPEDLENVGVGVGESAAEKVKEAEKDQPSRIREEAEILDAIPPKERSDLWETINKLYGRVSKELSTALPQDQKTGLALLQEAQDILLEKPRQFDLAKYNVSQVETLLQKRQAIVGSSKTMGWWIFAYDIVWIVALVALIFLLPADFPRTDLVALRSAMIWGTMGGVLGGFYGLYRHVSTYQDFDRQYGMWYFAQPIIGMLLGVAVYLIWNAGFLPINVEGSSAVMNLLPDLLAFIGGFRQRFVLDLIARVIDAVAPERKA